jgi:hypothetical protein
MSPVGERHEPRSIRSNVTPSSKRLQTANHRLCPSLTNPMPMALLINDFVENSQEQVGI